MQRRLLLAAGALALSACGFKLREAPDFAFDSIAISGSNSGLAAQLRRTMSAGGDLQVLPADAPAGQAQVVLDLLREHQEKVVVGLNASGQVREFQLRSILGFRLRTPQGRVLIPPTELVQERDVSFNESAVLAKESEEGLLYRDMQNDLVQQLMRRLAAVKSL
ncbi:LPS assembly lipoprotein LptE [Ramlibacter sp.]|uniref:LPS-assembly lipoprotein LptE n=1 Tax=Ramlibacter sp. TaxID=1917967 RepID=UPI002D5BD604|nr:LPS assembly lipoprotein LptE [Ramlibacter sp.]HYD76675.1 LPS assembly lipoprotein LptE [Ramlibacter sp.]